MTMTPVAVAVSTSNVLKLMKFKPYIKSIKSSVLLLNAIGPYAIQSRDTYRELEPSSSLA